jgi:hypothetical protein
MEESAAGGGECAADRSAERDRPSELPPAAGNRRKTLAGGNCTRPTRVAADPSAIASTTVDHLSLPMDPATQHSPDRSRRRRYRLTLTNAQDL